MIEKEIRNREEMKKSKGSEGKYQKSK